MRQAISIHVGLNAVNPTMYRGWSGPLRGCENDARAMMEIAQAQGFAARLLLGSDATRHKFLAELTHAAGVLAAGDLLLVTYSGHGASVEDHSGDEPDQRDEVWCLHDGPLLDDELHDGLCAFAARVRVLVVSDSCFSGSVTRQDQAAASASPRHKATSRSGVPSARDRRAPGAEIRAVLRAKRAEYKERRATAAPASAVEPAAGVHLLAACEDRQSAQDGDPHGLFTAALLATWNGGAFTGDHDTFLQSIRARIGDAQTPKLFSVGAVDAAFMAARPFTP